MRLAIECEVLFALLPAAHSIWAKEDGHRATGVENPLEMFGPRRSRNQVPAIEENCETAFRQLLRNTFYGFLILTVVTQKDIVCGIGISHLMVKSVISWLTGLPQEMPDRPCLKKCPIDLVN